jgi:hypothetical protein
MIHSKEKHFLIKMFYAIWPDFNHSLLGGQPTMRPPLGAPQLQDGLRREQEQHEQ